MLKYLRARSPKPASRKRLNPRAMSAKSEYKALEEALYEIERRIKPRRKSRKHWDPRRGAEVASARAEFRKLIKKFWSEPSEEDIPSPSNEDLFWYGDSDDRFRVVVRLDGLLSDREFIEPNELSELLWSSESEEPPDV